MPLPVPVVGLVGGCLGGAALSFGAGFASGRATAKARGKEISAKRASSPNRLAWHTPGAAKTGRDDAVVVVDPISTGARLALEARLRGFKLIRVLTVTFDEDFLDSLLPQECRGMDFDATIKFNEQDPEATVREIQAQAFHVVSVLIGCETGVEAYDTITELMPGVPTNGTATSAARRDKYKMGESVRAAGVRAVRQQECSKWEGEADAYVRSLGVSDSPHGPWCVLKPTRSAGTDGVYVCKSIGEAEENFAKIIGHDNVFGDTNQTVLVQEFLKGTEYVVDSVSVEGEHKCVAIWEYDKRPCNGHQFVYFGMRLYQSADGEREKALVSYMHSVLDALNVKHGPSHGEAIWLDSEDAPCLVEVGCRPHGGEGTFVEMTQPVLGYSQVSVMVDLVDKPYRFKRLPNRPERFAGGAMEVCLVSREEGTLAAYPKMPDLENLRSFQSIEVKVPVGGKLDRTINFVTTPGSVMLVHGDRQVVEEDQAEIHQWEEEGKFYRLAASSGSHVRMTSF